MLSAIIVAGGSSRRMGVDKTFAILAGKPVLAHTIAAFETCDSVAEVVIVGRTDCLKAIEDLVAQHGFAKITAVVAGGAHRQESVRAGLKRVAPEASHIAVHDAARPLITAAAIERVFDVAQEYGAAALAAPMNDTLKRATSDFVVCGSVDRERLYAMQTPQVFARELLEQAYERVAADAAMITDEVSAIEHIGRPVFLVANDEYNFKITFPHDLRLAELVLQDRAPQA